MDLDVSQGLLTDRHMAARGSGRLSRQAFRHRALTCNGVSGIKRENVVSYVAIAWSSRCGGSVSRRESTTVRSYDEADRPPSRTLQTDELELEYGTNRFAAGSQGRTVSRTRQLTLHRLGVSRHVLGRSLKTTKLACGSRHQRAH